MKYKIPDQFMGKPLQEWMKEPVKTPEQEPINPNLENKIDSWKISNVNYRNGIYVVDLAKELLSAKTQDLHAQHREQAIAKDEFYTGDMPLYHALFTALFKQKDRKEAEEARAFIQQQIRGKSPMTLTRIAYQPTGKDKVIHNFGTSEKYELDKNIFGEDKTIKAADSKALNAILGIGNVSEISSVYNWINQTPAYIWRVNQRPQKVDERVAGFDADSIRAYLSCSRNPGSSNASLGVRLVVRPK